MDGGYALARPAEEITVGDVVRAVGGALDVGGDAPVVEEVGVGDPVGRLGLGIEVAMVTAYPPPAQVLGVLMNAIFLDLVDQDAIRLERINRLLDNLPEDERNQMRPVKLLVVRPSRDLGRLVAEYEPRLPTAFKFMTRGLGTRER